MKAQNKSSNPKRPQAGEAGTMQCRRCTDGEVVRLKKTRRRDNDVYRYTGCGLIFSPASSQAKPVQQQTDQPEVRK